MDTLQSFSPCQRVEFADLTRIKHVDVFLLCTQSPRLAIYHMEKDSSEWNKGYDLSRAHGFLAVCLPSPNVDNIPVAATAVA